MSKIVNGWAVLLLTLACEMTVQAQTWDGTVADAYAGGDGSKEHPYLIATAPQWAKFSQDMSTIADFSDGKYFQLTADIVLNEHVYEGIVRSTRQDKEDLPQDITLYRETPCIGSYTNDSEYTAFKGTFDGAGHTVSGMVGSLYRSQTYDALFRVLEGATIMNLGVADSYLLSNARLGGIAGRMTDSRIINCFVEHSFIEGGGSQSGGFVGQMFGTSEVLNCYANDVTVFGKNDMGGFIGRIGDSNEHPCVVDNCYSRISLRVKRRNHGAISFACCTGSVIQNIYYERLGEITTDFWTGNKNGQVGNVQELTAADFAGDELVAALNDRAAQIEGACPWKMGDGSPVLDFGNEDTGIRAQPIVNSQLSIVHSEKIYNLHGQRLSQPKKGINIQNGKKIVVK